MIKICYFVYKKLDKEQGISLEVVYKIYIKYSIFLDIYLSKDNHCKTR